MFANASILLVMNKSSMPFVAFASCSLIWGSTFLVIRVGNDALPALWACTLRLAAATIVLHAILFATGQKWPQGSALKAAIGYGLLEFGLSMPLLYWGERVVPSGLSAVFFAIAPVVTMIAAKVLRIEELNATRFGAAVLAFVGVAVIFWREALQGASPAALASVFFAACTGPLAALVLQRGPAQGAVGVNAVGTLVGAPFAFVASALAREPWTMPRTFQEIFPVIYLTVAGSVGAFVIFAWLAGHWRATSIAFIGVVVPVIAVILGSLLRHEAFAAGSLAGAAIVIVGVTLALRSDRSLRRAET